MSIEPQKENTVRVTVCVDGKEVPFDFAFPSGDAAMHGAGGVIAHICQFCPPLGVVLPKAFAHITEEQMRKELAERGE